MFGESLYQLLDCVSSRRRERRRLGLIELTKDCGGIYLLIIIISRDKL